MECYEPSIHSSSAVPLLPPCRVCGEKASGLHYGVNTCEACKRFFCRIHRIGMKRACLQDQKCEARPGGRSRCGYCRYQRCLQVGMSIKGQQMGRYTTQQRTQNTLEARGLLDIKIDGLVLGNKEVTFQDTENSIEYLQMIHYSELPAVEKSTDVCNGMETTIKKVCAASKLYSLVWLPFHRDEDVWTKEVEFCQDRRKDLETYGCVQPFRDCIGNPYQALGVDTTNERDAMLIFIFGLEKRMRKAVKFAKSVPGFKQLPLDDQANLVKYSRFELWMMMCFSRINTKLNVAMSINGKFTHREDMESLFPKGCIADIYKMVSRIESIGLTSEELSILQAIVLTFTDRSHLFRPDLVAEIQDNLVACFELLLRRNHGREYLKLLMKSVDILIDGRSLSENNNTFYSNMASEWPEMKRSPLLLEMLNIHM